ncbi:MAG: polyamine aminopropyltransferase, partial [Ignavibacteriales bacterium]
MENWLKEEHTEGYYVAWKVNGVLLEEKTPYQKISVVDTVDFGRALVLDGMVQTTDRDEFIYHEMIAHVPMMAHPDPHKVLVIGGGDGGVVREVLKHSTVRHIDLVEIDQRVVEVSRQYFPAIALGLDDPRSHLHFTDGVQFVKDAASDYDVVIVDSSDPIGPAVQLFNEDFYKNVYKILREDGIMTAQAESPTFFQASFQAVNRNMRRVFPISGVYLACVPTYVSGFWA